MEQDLLYIDMPQYRVEYTEDDYSYNRKGKENLKKALYESSKGYCMYCYRRIMVDGEEYGQLEHAIEFSIFPSKLKNCVPNIGISCVACNNKYKKVGQKKRIPEQKDLKIFDKDSCCGESFCKEPCDAYKRLKKAYLRKEESRFIMQPLGVNSRDCGLPYNRQLLLQYDVLNGKYIPSRKEVYSAQEKKIIQHHIDLFGLNSDKRRSDQMICFLEDTIERNGNYSKMEYNNQVVELFVDFILKGKTADEVVKICEHLYTYAYIRFST